MNFKYVLMCFCMVPALAFGAERDDSVARVGVVRPAMAGTSRMPTMSISPKVGSASVNVSVGSGAAEDLGNVVVPDASGSDSDALDKNSDGADGGDSVLVSGNCREAYRACMDEFCLLDESEGMRCACSSNINLAKDKIQEIMDVQKDADLLYTEGVEREQLGAKAVLVFGQSEAAQKSSLASGLSFSEWINGTAEEGELGGDSDIGDNLYYMAAGFCAAELEACGAKADMEEMLYSRQIVSDCKSFDSYLADQKLYAEENKRTAESAVRAARLDMLDTTNKYNRGECLLAYRSCIADKGGCGANFENCLDADLLGRRANACDGVLDQCMAVKSDVLQDWDAESQSILIDAAKYADVNARGTCLARIQVCLEDNCSTSTNSACLTDVKVAAGICPVITECEEIIPGIQTVINDKLGYLRTQFCQNDIDQCLQDKCGVNFNAPECVGKSAADIAELCPQSMYPSCKNEAQFDIIVQAVLLQMDYQMLQGCVNYFGEQLGKTCGTDMSCLPTDMTVASLVEIPDNQSELAELRKTVIVNSETAVDEFFAQFEQDKTVTACLDSQKPQGRTSLGDSVFNTAKMIANIGAENRALRALESKIAELSRQQDLDAAEKNCLTTYAVESPDKSSKNYSYIRSVSFEPALRNCHICRMQQVCETGGETKGTAALKGAAGGLSAGAAAGTMVAPGWGTAIGGVVGALGGGLLGAGAAGEEEFCQEIESCEDVNM